MRFLTKLALAAAGLALTLSAASAQTTVRWLYLEQNPAQVKI